MNLIYQNFRYVLPTMGVRFPEMLSKLVSISVFDAMLCCIFAKLNKLFRSEKSGVRSVYCTRGQVLIWHSSSEFLFCPKCCTPNTSEISRAVACISPDWCNAAIFNSNGLLSQNLWHYLNQGRTSNVMLMRAARWMAYLHLSKLNVGKANILCSNPNCSGSRRDKVALRTTCIKDVKFKSIKIRTACQHVRKFYCNKNLNWAAHNLRLGCELDIAGVAYITFPLIVGKSEGQSLTRLKQDLKSGKYLQWSQQTSRNLDWNKSKSSGGQHSHCFLLSLTSYPAPKSLGTFLWKCCEHCKKFWACPEYFNSCKNS